MKRTTSQPKKTLVLGANGQLGRALQEVVSPADFFTRAGLDLSNVSDLDAINWSAYDTVINAAAYTKVDVAETPKGRRDAWRVNAEAVASLAHRAALLGKILVHYSTDYVFDGTQTLYDEQAVPNPLGSYGLSKAVGDMAVMALDNSYVLRTSWVVGDGQNFVRTMIARALVAQPTGVVDDQFGRLTFAEDLALATKHLLDSDAPYGLYNMSNDGTPASWADIAVRIFDLVGADIGLVQKVTTAEYFAGKPNVARRPTYSTLDLTKLKSSGFTPRYWDEALEDYVEKEREKA